MKYSFSWLKFSFSDIALYVFPVLLLLLLLFVIVVEIIASNVLSFMDQQSYNSFQI